MTTLIPLLLMLVNAPAWQEAQEINLGYIVTKGLVIRTTPYDDSRIEGTITQLCVMKATRAVHGWIRLEPASSGTDVDALPNNPPIAQEPCHKIKLRGWVKSDEATTEKYLLPETSESALFRFVLAWMDKWPHSVTIDVLHRRPRVGFTEDQMRAAMKGEPDSVNVTETASGTTKVYLYADTGHVITVTGGRVSAINRPGK